MITAKNDFGNLIDRIPKDKQRFENKIKEIKTLENAKSMMECSFKTRLTQKKAI